MMDKVRVKYLLVGFGINKLMIQKIKAGIEFFVEGDDQGGWRKC